MSTLRKPLHLLPGLALAGAFLFSPASVVAQEETSAPGDLSGLQGEVSLGLDFYTDYIWRGTKINDEPVFQPSFGLSAGNSTLGTFSASVWGNMDLGDEGTDNEGEFTEVDYTFAYSRSFDALGVELGVINYQFPNTDLETTSEVYLGLSYETEVGITPGFTAYYDFDEAEGFYLNASLDYSIEIAENLSLDLGVSAGFMDGNQAEFYYAGSDAGFSDINASVGGTYTINDFASVSAAILGTTIPDSDMRDTVDDPDNLYAMVGLSFTLGGIE